MATAAWTKGWALADADDTSLVERFVRGDSAAFDASSCCTSRA